LRPSNKNAKSSAALKGKRDKIRFVPVNAAAQRLIEDYLALTGHRTDMQGALFRPVTNNRTGRLDKQLDPRRKLEETPWTAATHGAIV
jgi:site-specific recombinase XerC